MQEHLPRTPQHPFQTLAPLSAQYLSLKSTRTGWMNPQPHLKATKWYKRANTSFSSPCFSSEAWNKENEKGALLSTPQLEHQDKKESTKPSNTEIIRPTIPDSFEKKLKILHQETKRLIQSLNRQRGQENQQITGGQGFSVEYVNQTIQAYSKLLRPPSNTYESDLEVTWRVPQTPCTKERAIEIGKAAQSLLDTVTHLYHSDSLKASRGSSNKGNNNADVPRLFDEVTYNSVMHVWACCASFVGTHAAVRAEEVLQQMIHRFVHWHSTNNYKSKTTPGSMHPPAPPSPTEISFHTAMDAWSKSGDINAGKRAERLACYMDAWWQLGNETRRLPQDESWQKPLRANARTFAAVIEAWSSHGSSDPRSFTSADAGRWTSNRAKREHFVNLDGSNDIHGARRAQAILEEMLSRHHHPAPSFHRSNQPIYRGRNVTMDLDMEGPPAPDIHVFHMVLKALHHQAAAASSLKKAIHAAQAAERVLHMMETVGPELNPPLQPTVRSFIWVMETWAFCCSPTNSIGPARAQELLERLTTHKKRHQFGGGMVEDNDWVAAYNAVINAWSRQSHEGDTQGWAAKKAQTLLNDMVKMTQNDHDQRPQRFGAGDGEINLTRDWFRMETSATPDVGHQAEVVPVGARISFALRPNVHSYNGVIRAWSNSGHVEALYHADQLVQQLLNQDSDLSPNATTFHLAMTVVAKRPHVGAGAKAESYLRLLQQQQEQKQDSEQALDQEEDRHEATLTHNNVLNAYAKEARYIFHNRHNKAKQDSSNQELGEEGSLSVASYVPWKEMERLLQEMEYPNVISYTCLLDALAHSTCFDKAHRARNVLQDLKNRCASGAFGMDLDVKVYTAVIQACAWWVPGKNDQTEEGRKKRREALEIALETFEEMRQEESGSQPNGVTYRLLMKAIWRLSVVPIGSGDEQFKTGNYTNVPVEETPKDKAAEEKRRRLMKEAFRLCCEDGYVDRKMLKMMNGSFDRLGRRIVQEAIRKIGGRRDGHAVMELSMESANPVKLEDIPLVWRRKTMGGSNEVVSPQKWHRGPKRQ